MRISEFGKVAPLIYNGRHFLYGDFQCRWLLNRGYREWSGLISGISGRCAAFGRKIYILTLRAGGLEIFSLFTIDSPLHRRWRSFPRWGTLGNRRENLLTKMKYRDFQPRLCRFPIKKCAASAAHLPAPRNLGNESKGACPKQGKTRKP